MLPFHYELSAMTKRTVRVFLPWIAALVASGTLAYALNCAVVGASPNSLEATKVMVVSRDATSDPELIDALPYDALEACLTAWRYVSAERPETYAAGLEQFLGSGCGAA